jgi:hypothetical protein
MSTPEPIGSSEGNARPATDTAKDRELARRLNLLTGADFAADCADSVAPILKKLLLWGGVAAAAWVAMILMEK